MTAEKQDEPGTSGLMGRLLLILILFNRAAAADLFSFRTSDATLLTVAYVGALLCMTGFVAVLWRKNAKDLETEESWPASEESGRVYGPFSEPLYQIPAVFCMLVVGIELASDLFAAPPASTMARWFLALLGIAIIAGIFQQLGSGGPSAGQGHRRSGSMSGARRRPTGPLSDPFFRVLLVTFAVLLAASEGVARIDREPSSVIAWVFMVAAIALAAFVAFDLISRFTRRPESTP